MPRTLKNDPKERPILFSGPMVRAILDGRKTQTRRIIKLKCHDGFEVGPNYEGEHWPVRGGDRMPCPYGKPGDRLWVRETWCNYPMAGHDGAAGLCYRATNGSVPPGSWKPSIHMPRAASRITLEIVSVRAELLHEITESDAIAEGATPSIVGEQLDHLKYRAGFQSLWESINGPESWAANPWVWVVEFKRLEDTQ